ncbi:MAG: hypothetical protein HPY71_13535 [Firmicutes bacterium]|nr:hypothetical protein [Bacillota bacterium]
MKIARLDRSTTQWDPDFRTTTQPIYSQPVEIRAQVNYERVEAQAMTLAGETPESMGHVTMLAEDFSKLGGFDKGDKIVEIGGLPVEAYITEARPAAFQSNGTYGLVMLMFESRRKGP